MNKALLFSLTEPERRLVAETERAALAELDEDGLVALHDRVRRARTKYVTLYRRQSAGRVTQHGGRGKAGPKGTRDRGKAEIFEEALARVSRALATAARESAAALRAERIAAARGESQLPKKAAPSTRGAPSARSARKAAPANKRAGDRALRSPASKKKAASVKSRGARRQARKDGR